MSSIPKPEESAVAKLDKLLDERGVKHYYPDKEKNFGGGHIEWRNSDGIGFRASNACFGVDKDEFARKLIVHMMKVTPEQAIAVTLGRPTWRNSYDQQRYDQWYDSLFHGEPSSLKELIEDVIWTTETIDLGPNGNECQGVDEGEVNTESMITTWAEKAAALGRGTLTAEDVRSFLNRNSVFDDTTWPHGRQELVFDEDDLQAMADELNATLGRGKCRIEHRGMGYYCSECGAMVGSDDPESESCIDANAIELWCFCPRCGSVVSA